MKLDIEFKYKDAHPDSIICTVNYNNKVYKSEASQILSFMCIAVHEINPFLPHCRYIAFSIYLVVSPRQDGMPKKRWRKKRSESETKKGRLT